MTYTNPFDPTQVGARVRALREYRGLNKQDFAHSVSIDPTSYGNIEKGKKPLKADMAFRIAERWGVSMDFLYRGHLTELPPNLAAALVTTLRSLNTTDE